MQYHISKHLKVRNYSLCLYNKHTVYKITRGNELSTHQEGKQSLSVNKGASGAEKMTSLCRRACAFYPLLKPFRRPHWPAQPLGKARGTRSHVGNIERREFGREGERARSEVVIVAGIQTEGNHKREREECRDGIGGGGGRILVPKNIISEEGGTLLLM